MRIPKIRLILIAILFMTNCREKRETSNKIQIQDQNDTDLDELLRIHDKEVTYESVDLPDQIASLEKKIDSLYAKIYENLRIHGRELDYSLEESQQNYKTTVQIDANLYQEIYDRGSGRGSFRDAYYRFYLSKFYEDLLLLKREIDDHFEEVK